MDIFLRLYNPRRYYDEVMHVGMSWCSLRRQFKDDVIRINMMKINNTTALKWLCSSKWYFDDVDSPIRYDGDEKPRISERIVPKCAENATCRLFCNLRNLLSGVHHWYGNTATVTQWKWRMKFAFAFHHIGLYQCWISFHHRGGWSVYVTPSGKCDLFAYSRVWVSFFDWIVPSI